MEEVPASSTEIEIKPAGVNLRLSAIFIDGIIVGIPILLINFIADAISGTPISFKGDWVGNLSTQVNIIIAIISFAITIGYNVYFLVTKGATFGKDIYGLQVVRYGTSERLSYGSAFIREGVKSGIQIIPFIGGILSFINGLVVFFSKEKKGIHDRIANTQVLRVKPYWSIWKQLVVFFALLTAFSIVFGIGILIKAIKPL